MKGNLFVTGIYFFIYIIFVFIFDCFNIDDNKLGNSIFSYFLVLFFTNIFIYFIIIIPTYARGFVKIMPLVRAGIYQYINIVFFVIILNYILKKFFPPNKMLLISDKEYLDELYLKINERKDIFNVTKKIDTSIDLNEIYSICKDYKNVIIGDISSNIRNDILKYCFSNSIITYVLPKLSDIILKNSKELYVIDSPIIVSNNFGIDAFNSFFKRIFDIIFSIISIVILSPIFIIVSLLIKIEDGGDILFIQKRVTIDNKIFDIYKFRSMKMDNNQNKVIPTIDNDDRITKIGKFIRKFHIDELPQLFNCLKGDMSIVGPRPERIEHVRMYTDKIIEFKYRSKVRAGITGLAQIYGRYNTTAYDKLKLDLIYISNYSILFDIELILKTLKVLVMKENTEGFDESISKKITEYNEQ